MKTKKLYSVFSLFVIGVIVILVATGFYFVNSNQKNNAVNERRQGNAILTQDIVAIDLAGDYFIELSDPVKICDFIHEGNRTKGIYLILSKTIEKQNEIFYDVITNCETQKVDVNCKPVSMRNPVHHEKNSETVYVMSVEFVRIR